MTDIVERLRFNAARKSDLDADKRSLAEAADEIERLRARVEELEAFKDRWARTWREHRVTNLENASYKP